MATIEPKRPNNVMHEPTDHPPFREEAQRAPSGAAERPVTERPTRELETSLEVVTGGSTGEAIGGAAAVVLAILGLAGVIPIYTLTVAALAVGVGLLIEGGALTSRYSQLLSRVSSGRLASAELGGGMSAELIGGIGGGVLALLALLGVAPMTLVPVAALVFGGALLFGAGATARLRNLAVHTSGASELARRIASESVSAASGAQIFVGIGAITLGILALVGVEPMTLMLVATLALGGALLISGAAIGARMASLMAH